MFFKKRNKIKELEQQNKMYKNISEYFMLEFFNSKTHKELLSNYEKYGITAISKGFRFDGKDIMEYTFHNFRTISLIVEYECKCKNANKFKHIEIDNVYEVIETK